MKKRYEYNGPPMRPDGKLCKLDCIDCPADGMCYTQNKPKTHTDPDFGEVVDND